MIKEYAVQTRNKEHSTRWDDFSDIFNTLKEARAQYADQLSRNRSWGSEKKITRLVSFTVTDYSVPIRERPAIGCIIHEVLEYHEDK